MLRWKTEPIFLELSAQGWVSSGLSPFTSFPYMGTARQLVVTICGGALLKRFILCCEAQIQSVDFWFLSSWRGQSSLSFHCWIAWSGRVCIVNWGYLWAVVSGFILCPSLFMATCPAIVMVGTWQYGSKSQETGRLSPSVI